MGYYMEEAQLTLEDAARQWHIARLTRSLERWRATELDQILPEEYARYCATLAHLQTGGAYVIRDVTQELLAECGRGICRTILKADAVTRQQRKARRAAALGVMG
jgi:hypothetical protein